MEIFKYTAIFNIHFDDECLMVECVFTMDLGCTTFFRSVMIALFTKSVCFPSPWKWKNSLLKTYDSTRLNILHIFLPCFNETMDSRIVKISVF